MTDMKRRCCATCSHYGPIDASIPYFCADCIQDGECTRWEDAGGEDHEER